MSTPAVPLSTRAKIDLIIGAILICAFFVLGRTWLAEHDARLKAESTVAAAQKSFDQASVQMKQLQDGDKSRDAATAATIAKFAESAAAQTTPQQIAAWLPKQLSLPQPIAVQVPASTATNPAPPAIATIPVADLAPLKDLVAQGQECAAKLPAAQQDLSSCQAQAKLLSGQVEDRNKQIAALNEELKGGTFWHRLKGGAKKVVIGAAIGAVAICASGHCK